ncbi:exosome complex component CSL4 [Nematocida sp. AWRm80]|nr:exosome complex component CSL4 [Nematocida sp. AWRm80]
MPLPGESTYIPKYILPQTSDSVTAVVEYVCYAHVMVTILTVNGNNTPNVSGIIHREDCMYGIKDEHKLNELFSPGDIIHGKILSLGNTGDIVISTANEMHGVIKAIDFNTLKEIPLKNNQFILNGAPLKRKTAILDI